MVLKKKSFNILYILLLGLVFIIFCGTFSTCYAMSNSDLEIFMEKVLQSEPYVIRCTKTATQYVTTISNNFDFTNYDYVYVWLYVYGNGVAELNFLFDNIPIHGAYTSNFYWKSGQDVVNGGGYKFNIKDNNLSMSTPSFTSYNINSNTYVGYSFRNDLYGCTNYFVYGSNWIDECTYTYNNFEITNSIILYTPITSFHRYYGLSDKGQLQVTLTGDYTIEDFTFFIQKSIDNEWQVVTGINDYYLLYDNVTNDIYRNPYYITFANISYLETGTYRFMAYLNDNPETAFYSSSFDVVPWSITENVSGTVDGNGNVDFSIDTGNTVENIADYFSSPANFDNVLSQNEIDNALNLDYMENPYQNFILTFFNGLVSAFSDNASSISFKVHTWGESRVVHVSDIAPAYNNDIRVFLTIMSTIAWCFVIVKWCTKILDGLTHMSLQDSVDLIDAHYSDLF